MATQTRWTLKQVPGGAGGEAAKMGDGAAEKAKLPGYKRPEISDFEEHTEPVPTADQLGENEVLYKHEVLSPDPFVAAYCMGPDNVGKTIVSTSAGVVLASTSPAFAPGDHCIGMGGACEVSIAKADSLRKISPEEGSEVPFDPTHIPISASLGILGMPGATSYLATRNNLGSDLSGQTVVVTGAAGAVGSAAGQLAKIFGAQQVIGFAGSDAKCALGRERYGFDVMLNYKTADVEAELDKVGPIQGFFDNTGGPVAKAVKARMVDGGKVSKVGDIGGPDGYDKDDRLQIAGFYAGGCREKWPEAFRALAGYIEAGQLKYDETIEEGIAAFPAAFTGMMAGKNEGKMVVKLA